MENQSIPKIIYHYTNQEGLLGIIKEKAIWATHMLFLNDFSELSEPLRIARETVNEYRLKLTDAQKENNKENLDRISAYNSYLDSPFSKKFVASFCDNGDLLSQWRGYGAFSSAYAIGFDSQKIKQLSLDFNLTPCRYCNKEEYNQEIKKLIRNILEPDSGQNASTYSEFVTFATTVKLDCFQEEKEWRLIQSGRISDDDPNIQFRSSKSMIIPYYSVPLFDLSSIVEVRIGPCQNPILAQDAICRLAEKYKVHNLLRGDIRDRIKISRIPYRVF